MTSLFAVLVGAAISVACLSAAGNGAKTPPADVSAVLEAHCVKCHGREKTKGGLDSMTREAMLRGGESGAAVPPGKPDASHATILHLLGFEHTRPTYRHNGRAERLTDVAGNVIAKALA